MNLGPIEMLLVLVMLASYVLPVWAVVDAAMRPESDFDAIGVSKVTQIIVLVAFALLCGIIGTIISIVYLVSTRPKLRRLRTA